MANYNPPIENITEFNTTLFNNDTPPIQTGGGTGDLTKAQADTYYLSKVNSDTSTSALTTFNGQLKTNNPLVITAGSTPSSTISQSGDNTLINNNNNSGQIIFNAKSSGGTPLDVLSLEQTQIVANVTVVYKANAIQYTEVNQLAQIMRFINKSISGSINLSCQTAGGVDTTCMSISTQGISLNANTVSQGSTSISSNFFYLATTGGVKNLFTNANNAGLNFSSANSATTFNGISTFNQEVKIPTRLTVGATQYASEVLTISGTTSTLTFPLQETIMLTSTGASIAITLPTITLSRQCGFTFVFTKTASLTNSVILTAGGSNQIIPYGSITNASPYTTMVAGMTCFHLITLEISTGVFAWREI